MRQMALADVMGVGQRRLPLVPPPPDIPAGHRPIFLLDASTGLEERLLRTWIERLRLSPPPEVVSLTPSRIRRRHRRTEPRLAGLLEADPAALVVPLRVVWMPAQRRGRRMVSWIDVLKLGDPRDPRWFRDYLILSLRPDRVRITVGEGARAGDLVEDHRDSSQHSHLSGFVTRRAWRALDRAERVARGNRYKIPNFVAEDIVDQPEFRDQVARLGKPGGLSQRVSVARARYYLSEIAATHSPFVIDLIANFIHWILSQGYGAIRYDKEDVAEVARLGREHPVAFLPSHRSNLDRLALQFMLWENDLPPNHTAGGINLNFFPVGPLIRRTGVFFIRRSFKGNHLYKYVLRSYLNYLVGKRFPLEWYMEGGRSRSGKLRPPRFGMLSWVVDSMETVEADDLYLLPISIAYDKIHDVTAYAAEAAGGTKERESLSWALRFIRGLRRRHGDIHITFGEPISVRKELPELERHVASAEIQKLAFQVMYRIGLATPVTPTAVVSIALLAAKGKARDTAALAAVCAELAAFIERHRIPTTAPIRLENMEEVGAVLAGMVDHGLLSTYAAGARTVYWMEPHQMLRASYYRNTVVHFFVPRGLAEIALSAGDLDAFWTDVMELRDLLKFEFFFADKEEFRHLIALQLDADTPGWDKAVAGGDGASVKTRPVLAGWAVLPLLEAYLVAADELAATKGDVVEKRFLAACLDRGRLYRLEGRISSDESVSQVLFAGALRLAENRGLTGGDVDPAARERFAGEIALYTTRAG